MRLFIILLAMSTAAGAAEFKQQALDDANACFRSATNAAMYAEAAMRYERLVVQDDVRNGDLFYTTGNSWFMAGDVGRAILNYRRAEWFLPRDRDVRHNLKVALQSRADLIPEKSPPPIIAKLFGWHLNTTTAFRGWTFSVCWIVGWAAWIWLRRTGRKEARITTIATGVVSIALLLSLGVDGVARHRARPGVITARETLARKGDGEMYTLAFMDPLHSGTEFQLVEARGDWLHIQLDDGQRCWISASAAELVRL